MRKAGILLPIFSLPSNYGVGSLGEEAYKFIDFLVRVGQSVWQILPLTSTNSEDFYSPYKTNGAFSGNFDFIDIDMLIKDGFLTEDFVKSIDLEKYQSDPRYIDYEKVRALKKIFFTEAFRNFDTEKDEKFKNFSLKNIFWIDEFCIYMALREINNSKAYWQWSTIKDLKDLKSEKNKKIKEKFDYLYSYHKFLQFLFFEQWSKLKKYANDNGIEIFGDIPMYISDDSSDFYFHREMFLTDKNNEPSFIAGVPPDDFSDKGQCWGNPLYDWDYLKKNDFVWWLKRIESSFELYDILRIDHFRGFESYYRINRDTKDAINGEWIKTPGKEFFEILKKKIPNAKIVAEDLGIITNEVIELLEYTGYPGMKIIQFGFNSNADNTNLPHAFHKNTVAYTGTHDNATLAEWLQNTEYGAVEYAKQYLRLETYKKYTEGFIRSVVGSCSDLIIIPIQDWLDFGAWARINTPSTVGLNWKFRLLKNELNSELEKYISYICGLYGRYKNR